MATQVAQTRVYRSQDAYVGGVCAGLAERFDLDPIVVRILAIFIVLLTLGVGIIPYVILWVRLPRESDANDLYEVTPESAESNAYGCVDCQTGRAGDGARKKRASSVSMLARLAVAVGLMLLFLLVATNISPLMPGTEWWQFWPIAFLIMGLCLIIIPIPTRLEAAWHAAGIVVTSLAATVLPMSLDLMSWQTLPVAFAQAWPLVVAAIVLFAIGAYRKIDALMVGAAFLIVAFCLVSLMLCAQPGNMETLLLHMPDGRLIKISFVEG